MSELQIPARIKPELDPDLMLLDVLAPRDLPGAAAVVASTEHNLHFAAGVSCTRTKASMSTQGRVPISCVIKPLVALICLYADEKGLMDVKADVGDYLPLLKPATGEPTRITLLDLLTHTAGYVEPEDIDVRWGYTWERFVDFFPARKQVFTPGSVWSYTHTGYVIVQKCIEVAFGRPLLDLLHEWILGPLGIDLIPFGELGPTEPHHLSLHVKSTRTGVFEPMRPPQGTGFLRYSLSDLTLSTEHIARLGRFLAGAYKTQMPDIESARLRLLQKAIDLPGYVLGKEGEKMPTAFCQGVFAYGPLKGLNGSYVGSTCSIRFDDETSSTIATTLNAWAPHARDRITSMLSEKYFAPAKSAAHKIPEVTPDWSSLQGDYEGLMLGALKARLALENDELVCTVKHRNIPAITARLSQKEGGLAFAGGSPGLSIAISNAPETGAPMLMVGTSACYRVAA